MRWLARVVYETGALALPRTTASLSSHTQAKRYRKSSLKSAPKAKAVHRRSWSHQCVHFTNNQIYDSSKLARAVFFNRVALERGPRNVLCVVVTSRSFYRMAFALPRDLCTTAGPLRCTPGQLRRCAYTIALIRAISPHNGFYILREKKSKLQNRNRLRPTTSISPHPSPLSSESSCLRHVCHTRAVLVLGPGVLGQEAVRQTPKHTPKTCVKGRRRDADGHRLSRSDAQGATKPSLPGA